MSVALDFTWDRAYLPRSGPAHRALLVHIRAPQPAPPPIALLLLLDVGSSLPGVRLRAAREASAAAWAALRPGDRLQVRTFDWRTRPGIDWVTKPEGAAEPPGERIEAGLVTALEHARACLDRTRDEARALQIVTDDDPLDGEVESPGSREAALRIVASLAAEGVITSCFEVGANLGLRTPWLAELADRGGGRFASLPRLDTLSEQVRRSIEGARSVAISEARLSFERLSGELESADRIQPDYAELSTSGGEVALGSLGTDLWLLADLNVDVESTRAGERWPVGELVLRGLDADRRPLEIRAPLASEIADPPTVYSLEPEVDRLRRWRDQARAAVQRPRSPTPGSRVRATENLAESAAALGDEDARRRFAEEAEALKKGGTLPADRLAEAIRLSRRQPGWITSALDRIQALMGRG